MLQHYRPTLHYHIVKWMWLENRLVKCNTDGASKENSRKSSYDFCVSESNEGLIYVEAQDIKFVTNMEAESRDT